ncbi:lysosomal cobalamin transporter ABCD4-like [Ornithodoros turicata]|uniref:lysosomal cobalamin transporter ABCD4-like n=1 Tax=Ornithodoros turicata TaxID=34597 RepID=UPI00313942FE
MQPARFNWLFFRRFWVLCGVVLKQRNALVLLLGLLIIAIVYEVNAYYVGIISSKYYVVLGARDWNGFWSATAQSVGIILAIAVVRALRTYVSNLAGVQWRMILTEDLHRLYFSSRTHYTVNVLEDWVDNPDQRMTQDVDRFCQRIADVLPAAFIAPFTTAYYTYQCASIAGWSGPLSAFVFFLTFAVINKFLLSPVVPRVYEQEKQEGKFRHLHASIRAHSESITFLDGEAVEQVNTNRQLMNLVRAQTYVVNRQLPLNVGVHMFDYLGSILSFLVIAVPIFNGTYDDVKSKALSGIISKNAFVTIYLISCFSSLVDLSGGFSVICGNTHRIAALRERMLKHARDEDLQAVLNSDGTSDGDKGPAVELVDVSYNSPRDNEPLVENLTLSLDTNRNVLVTGPSGSGKTMLLRVIKGLREASSGTVKRTREHSILFMPQVPWLTVGSLRNQIAYPSLPAHSGDEERDMVRLLELAGLEHLLRSAYSLDAELDAAWYDALSPGEKQRLSWVRMLHQRPPLAFLDEPTAAVGYELKSRLYEECAKRDIRVVVVGYQHEVKGWEPDLIITTRENGVKRESSKM